MKVSIRGELFPHNTDVMENLFTYRWLCQSFLSTNNQRNQYLHNKLHDDNWKWKEGESFVVDMWQKAEGVPAEGQKALNYINITLNAPIARTLKLDGYLNVVVEGRTGILLYNVQIIHNQVQYREQTRDWEIPITMPLPDHATETSIRDMEDCELTNVKVLPVKLNKSTVTA